MAEIEIRRGVDTVAMFRPVIINCDGNEVAQLRPRKRVVVDLSAGTHRFVASLDTVTSSVLDVDLDAASRPTLVAKMSWTGSWSFYRAVRKGQDPRQLNPQGMLTLSLLDRR